MAEKFAVGATFSSSIGIKAIRAMIDFILDLISLVLTIVTFGIGSCIYALKLFKVMAKTAEKAKKIRDMMKKVKKAREKIEKIKKKVDKVQKHARKAANFVPADGD